MTPPADRPAEAARLRAIHTPDPYEGLAEALKSGKRGEGKTWTYDLPCDYCDDGDVPVDGIHLVPDPECIEGTWRVPCPRGGAA